MKDIGIDESGDDSLCRYLEDFANQLIERSCELQAQCFAEETTETFLQTLGAKLFEILRKRPIDPEKVKREVFECDTMLNPPISAKLSTYVLQKILILKSFLLPEIYYSSWRDALDEHINTPGIEKRFWRGVISGPFVITARRFLEPDEFKESLKTSEAEYEY